MIGRLSLESIKTELGSHNAIDLFRHAKNKFLRAHLLTETSCENKTLNSLIDKIAIQLNVKPSEVWSTGKFHMLFRATKPKHLEILGISGKTLIDAREAVYKGRVMSLLPYNTTMGELTINKFIPSQGDKFSGRWEHSMDPYALFRKIVKVIAVDGNGNETYLGTRKFSNVVLANITESCPIGCDGCYKGSMVRTSLAFLADIHSGYAEIKKQLNTDEERAVSQAKLLVMWLNENPEVDTIIVSGGEPTMFSNNTLKKIFDEYKKAKYVRMIRICTSSIFQGMWYRIDKDLVKILSAFRETSGKQIHFNAHVTDEHQLTAPEARIATDMLHNNGISIHLQMPLQEGINFRRDDLSWSTDKLRTICKQAYFLDVVPYNMIVDMHSPSNPSITVPLETVTKLIRFLDSHSEHSGEERWKACTVLHEQGNIYLSSHPHFVGVKDIDEKRKRVTYFIPMGEGAIHTYEEPLIDGHNDDPDSLGRIADADMLTRIEEIKIPYSKLVDRLTKLEKDRLGFEQKVREIEKMEKEYFKISGIRFPRNKPLLI